VEVGDFIFDYREYLIAIGAVFLALALGILIGVSFGDSFLVANQRDIIELMEGHLGRLREVNRQQEIELQRWETIKPLVQQSFRGALAGKKIVVIGNSAPEADKIKALLEKSGAGVTAILIPGASEETVGSGQPFLESENLLTLLAGTGELDVAGLRALGLQLPETETTVLEWPPECCLLLFEREALSSGTFFNELWRGLHESGARVIALFPWPGNNAPLLLPEIRPEPSLVDNIDTFWGQIALLKMLAENACGHYGFDSGSSGLFPGAVKND
jgi:hypothetical protein